MLCYTCILFLDHEYKGSVPGGLSLILDLLWHELFMASHQLPFQCRSAVVSQASQDIFYRAISTVPLSYPTLRPARHTPV
jgi:hypothetical protein